MNELKDNFGRVHDYLRVSLTDKCNLNCTYCNPLTDGKHKAESNLLPVDDLAHLIEIFTAQFGIKKIRLTGGEPLAGSGTTPLLDKLKSLKEKYDFSLYITTNGVLLSRYLPLLKQAGVKGINISLDSLKQNTYREITGHDSLNKVINSIDEAFHAGFEIIKINCVVMRGVNDNEVTDFVEYFGDKNVTVRFIEYMPFAQNGWNGESFIGSDEMITMLSRKYNIQRMRQNAGSVSSDYTIAGKKCKVGFISSISNHFCNSCSRLRLTAEGKLRLCLFGSRESELDLAKFMRTAAMNDGKLAEIISEHMKSKPYKHPPVDELVKMDFNYMLKAGG